MIVPRIDRFRFVCCWRRRLILYNPEVKFLLEGVGFQDEAKNDLPRDQKSEISVWIEFSIILTEIF